MEKFITLEQIDQAVKLIRSRTKQQPRVGMILGSGLGDLANSVENPDIIPFSDIPHMPQSTVVGHIGQLVIGKLEGQVVMVMQGRVHYYEGYTMGEITFPIRVMKRLGVEYLIITNAAGAINPDFVPGDVMLITDHISLLPMAGPNPLRGPNIDEFGERFPDMSQAYDHALMQLAHKVATEENLKLQEIFLCGIFS